MEVIPSTASSKPSFDRSDWRAAMPALDHPLFFHYLSVYPETPMEDWQTDIYVPLV